MNERKPERCEHIAVWLLIATKDLCRQAQSRIWVEIQGHYKEAVESWVADGQSIEKAETLALDGLGDPKEAGRKFRKTHLTENENIKVQRLTAVATGPYPKGNLVAEILLFVGAICAVRLGRDFFGSTQHYYELAYSYTLMMFAKYPLKWIFRVAAKTSPPHSATNRIVLINIMGEIVSAFILGILICFLFYPDLSVSDAFITGFVSFVLFIPASIIPWQRIWRKVRRGNADWDLAHSGSNPTTAN